MVEQLQVTHEHTLDVTWMLTEEEISELRTNDAAKTQCLITLQLGDQWLILFRHHGQANSRDIQSAGDHFPQLTSPANDHTYGFFDSSTYADTVFIVHQPGRPPLHIFACENILVSASSHFKTRKADPLTILSCIKHQTDSVPAIVFESGFSESTSRRKFDVEKLANHEKDDYTSTSALIDQQLLPFYSSETESTPQPSASENQASNDHANSSAPTPSSEPSRKRIKLEEGNGSDPSAPETTGRLMNAIDVHETDFRTYRAMISHLHTPVVPFLPVTSNYLVEHFNNELDYSCPLDWLQEQFEELDSSFDWSGVEPCSAAAMYRLSDRYDLEDLRELSLGFIIRSLTIENVPYELFSSLSLDYEAVQKPILEFFVKNWSEVRKSKGFKLVLEQFSLGKLAKGKDLMGKIFEMISQS
ncbi:hypothetical protein JCM3765_003639 [Sporobolomyces pararoseus]